jgi:hypothetical protein
MMLDVHPITHLRGGWREFLLHIATISVGLLIAVALEQAVEKLHQIHQRHQLQHDLREEAERNRETLKADLALESESTWFAAALMGAKGINGETRGTLILPATPCLPGTLGANGTDPRLHTYYFAPSDAVWVTARDAGLIARLPALQTQYATMNADGASATWTLNAGDAQRLAAAAANADTLLHALLWRLRWNLVFEEGILRGQNDVDAILMNGAAKSR